MTKIVFFGSSQHSVIILNKLLKIPDFNIIAVVSKQDKPTGRSQTITPNPIADYARINNIKLLQPADFDAEFISEFRNLNPDLALVVAFGPPYFTQEMIDIPKYKIVNIHPSPLPKYRGATPGPWQIINNETESSVSFFQIDALPDHGPIISQTPFEINPKETAATFYNKAFNLAADQLEKILKNYVADPSNIIPQNHDNRSYFPKFSKDNAQINWSWSEDKIERFIRALNPWPIAWTFVKNQQNQQLRMKILSAQIISNHLQLMQIQIEGKKPTSWKEIEKYYSIVK